MERKSINRLVKDVDFKSTTSFNVKPDYDIQYDMIYKEDKESTFRGQACYSNFGYGNTLRPDAIIRLYIPFKYCYYGKTFCLRYIKELNKMDIFYPISEIIKENKDMPNYYFIDVTLDKEANYVKALATCTALRYMWERNAADYRVTPYWFLYMCKFKSKVLNRLEMLYLSKYGDSLTWYGGGGHCLFTYKECEINYDLKDIKEQMYKCLRVNDVFMKHDKKRVGNIPFFKNAEELELTIAEYLKQKEKNNNEEQANN